MSDIIKVLEALDSSPREHIKRPTIIHIEEDDLRRAIARIAELEAETKALRGNQVRIAKFAQDNADGFIALHEDGIALPDVHKRAAIVLGRIAKELSDEGKCGWVRLRRCEDGAKQSTVLNMYPEKRLWDMY